MPRRSDKRRDSKTQPIANTLERIVLDPVLPANPVSRGSHYVDLDEIEDRRTFHPRLDDRPALTFDGTPAHIVNDPNVNKSRPTKRFKRLLRIPSKPQSVFREPARQILVCVRRKRRKEILHAFKQTGRGKGHKRARKTWLSSVKCK